MEFSTRLNEKLKETYPDDRIRSLQEMQECERLLNLFNEGMNEAGWIPDTTCRCPSIHKPYMLVPCLGKKLP